MRINKKYDDVNKKIVEVLKQVNFQYEVGDDLILKGRIEEANEKHLAAARLSIDLILKQLFAAEMDVSKINDIIDD